MNYKRNNIKYQKMKNKNWKGKGMKEKRDYNNLRKSMKMNKKKKSIR